MKFIEVGHIYLKKYHVIAIIIIFFFMWQTQILTTWYMEHFKELKEWQNVPVIGLIGGYITALKFALTHILPDIKNDTNSL